MRQYILKRARHFSKRQKFFDSLRNSGKVLDLGCGKGNNGSALKELYPEIELYGLDILPDANIPNIYSYQVVDLDKGILPFPSEYFDAIIFTHVIEHLHSPFRLGKEINRVARKGAQIYVETPNWTTIFVPSFGFHREQHNPFNFYDDPTHVKPWSQHSLFEFLFQACSFRVVKIGNTQVWERMPFDIIMIVWGLIRKNRALVVSSFWNLYGWCIYGIAIKE